MSIDVLKSHLTSGNIGGVYIFTGQEEYLKKFYIGKIKSGLNIDEADAFNYMSVSAEDLTLAAFNDFFMNGPVFSDKKLMYITCFDSDDVSAISAKDIVDALGAMKDSFPSYCVLIIDCTFTDSTVSKNFAAESKKALGNTALSIDIDKRSTGELTTWILRHAASEKVEMSRDAAEYLLSVTDNGMYNLTNEMAKLFGASDKVDKELIDSLVIKTVDARIFDFTDALISGDSTRAMALLHDLWEKEQDTVIMGSIYNSFTRMYIVKLLSENGLNKSEIAQKTSLKPYAVGKTLDACRNISIETIRDIISDCMAADDNMKRFAKDKKMEMDILTLRIISKLK